MFLKVQKGSVVFWLNPKSIGLIHRPKNDMFLVLSDRSGEQIATIPYEAAPSSLFVGLVPFKLKKSETRLVWNSETQTSTREKSSWTEDSWVAPEVGGSILEIEGEFEICLFGEWYPVEPGDLIQDMSGS